MRVIEEVRPEVKAITIIGAGCVARGGDRDAFIGYRRASSRGGELSDHPTIGQLIIEDDRITGAAGLAGATEAAPERTDAIRPEDRVASGFVEDLVTFVHHLDILRQTRRHRSCQAERSYNRRPGKGCHRS